MAMKQLKYIGSRTKSFTVKCPSGNRYLVEPEVSRVIEVTEEDALYMFSSQPTLWQAADVDTTPIPMAEVPDERPSDYYDADSRDGRSLKGNPSAKVPKEKKA